MRVQRNSSNENILMAAGWISGQAGDALATRLAFYAVRAAGIDEAIANALDADDQFLIRIL